MLTPTVVAMLRCATIHTRLHIRPRHTIFFYSICSPIIWTFIFRYGKKPLSSGDSTVKRRLQSTLCFGGEESYGTPQAVSPGCPTAIMRCRAGPGILLPGTGKAPVCGSNHAGILVRPTTQMKYRAGPGHDNGDHQRALRTLGFILPNQFMWSSVTFHQRKEGLGFILEQSASKHASEKCIITRKKCSYQKYPRLPIKADYKEYDGEKPIAFHNFFVEQSGETEAIQNPTEYNESFPKIFKKEGRFLKNMKQACSE
ncbi:hypothetical protein Y032_0245g3547 [Ancylostoma ceylanicum]|uniref:Uncharacterized protein n=1 Tax=Ancylostoma ceylanicum TaxID=53326 RepID=A0A016SDU8_9BILA|nr:hypothetical protein Y032_0245g3547 [Ancylostoma ceylanicum]